MKRLLRPSKGSWILSEVKERDYQRFLNHLDESHMGVFCAARWLSSRGYAVSIQPTTTAEHYSDRMDHVDSGDLYISMRVEVKTLSVNFTCKEDWPFGEKFIVCAKHSFDNARPKPYGYIIQSADLKHAAVVSASSFKQWYSESRRDSRYEDMTQNFYLCPLDVVKFVRM